LTSTSVDKVKLEIAAIRDRIFLYIYKSAKKFKVELLNRL